MYIAEVRGRLVDGTTEGRNKAEQVRGVCHVDESLMLTCSVFWTHQEYLLKLQAIRQQNYQERKRIQQRMVSGKVCGWLLLSQHKS